MFTKSVIISLLFIVFAQETTYYVSNAGSDTTTCGTEASPCATINKVISNYPGLSYTVSISPGSYRTDNFTFQGSEVLIFQGTGYPTIIASWDGGIFITNTNTSGFEFHDQAFNISAIYGSVVTTLNGVGNIVGFYNIVLNYVDFPFGDFIRIYGGTLTINNLTLDSQAFNASFVTDASTDNGDDSNISIIGSTFSRLNILEYGSLIGFDAYKTSNITLDSNSFYDVYYSMEFIGLFPAENSNPTIIISNNLFDSVFSHYPNVFIQMEIRTTCVISVQNTSWNNSTAYDLAGALGIYGSPDRQDHKITLNNLSCYNCSGNYSGAIFVGFNSLILSNSIFGNNTGSRFGNDVVQGLDAESSQFGYSITNSYSSSALPKAAVWNLSSGAAVDISNLLPNPPEDMGGRHVDHSSISTFPKSNGKSN